MEQKAINKEVMMAQIEAKYDAKVKRIVRRYQNRTMEELWHKLDEIKAQMKAEMEQYGLNEVKYVEKDEKLLTTEEFAKQSKK